MISRPYGLQTAWSTNTGKVVVYFCFPDHFTKKRSAMWEAPEYMSVLHVESMWIFPSVRPYVRRKQSPPQVREFNPNFEQPSYSTSLEHWGEGDSYLKLVLHTVGPQN